MLFSTDCVFRIGSTHKICQDYGISGTVCDTAYAIIADGCSGSDLSEFGSKLLCKAIENEIVEDEFQNFTSNNSGYRINSEISLSKVFSTLFDIGNKLKMPDYWLDATLAYAVAKKGVAQIYLYGDGVIVREWPDGTSTVTSVEFPSGFPFYLNYITTSNRKRFEKWKSIPNQKKVVLTYHLDKKGNLENTEEEYLSLSNKEKDLPFSMSILDFENSKLALFTDGIKSFFRIAQTDTSKVNVPVSMINIIPSLMKIKSFQGQFVNRRLNKFLQKENVLHFDDITMAVIKMGKLDEDSCSGKRDD